MLLLESPEVIRKRYPVEVKIKVYSSYELAVSDAAKSGVKKIYLPGKKSERVKSKSETKVTYPKGSTGVLPNLTYSKPQEDSGFDIDIKLPLIFRFIGKIIDYIFPDLPKENDDYYGNNDFGAY